jgi:hypothetical protein
MNRKSYLHADLSMRLVQDPGNKYNNTIFTQWKTNFPPLFSEHLTKNQFEFEYKIYISILNILKF